MGGQLVTKHIVKSSAPTFPAEEWVKAEVEVRGNDEIIHRVNGVEVLSLPASPARSHQQQRPSH